MSGRSAGTTSSSPTAVTTPRSSTASALSFGQEKKFRHNDIEDLEQLLAAANPEHGKLIVSDGVFSMEGDLCNLPGIVELAKKYDARLMVDDAHGIGVLGEHGRGTAEHFGLDDETSTW